MARSNPDYMKVYRADPYHYSKARMKNWQRTGASIDGYGQFIELLVMSEYTCEICGVNITENTANLDHDHTTGRVRGVLCWSCNAGIGHLGDSADGLRRALRFIEES